MTAEAIFEVIMKLNGRINPVSDPAIDQVRQVNMERFISLLTLMFEEIDFIARTHKDSPFHSAKTIGKISEQALTNLRNSIRDEN